MFGCRNKIFVLQDDAEQKTEEKYNILQFQAEQTEDFLYTHTHKRNESHVYANVILYFCVSFLLFSIIRSG